MKRISLLIMIIYLCNGVSPQAVDRYDINSSTIDIIYKDPEKTEIKYIAFYSDKELNAVLGDKTTEEFKPELRLNKWGGDTYISINLREGSLGGNPVFIDGKIKYPYPDKDIYVYPIPSKNEERIEYELILKQKPTTNKFIFDINTKNLRFLFQPPLNISNRPGCNETECLRWGKFGVEIYEKMPVEIVNSYAVYHINKRDNEYKTGKAFHIYRPKIRDNSGAETWGELDINEGEGTLTITINQKWLNNAKYPLSIDPTFGYTSIGGTCGSDYDERLGYNYTVNESGEVINISFYTKRRYAGSRFKAAIYLGNKSLLFNQSTCGNIGVDYAWHTVALSPSPNITSGESYYPIVWQGYWDSYRCWDVNYDNVSFFDTAEPAGDISGCINWAAWNPLEGSFSDNRQWSIYASYTTGAPPPDTDPPTITLYEPANNSNTSENVTFTGYVSDVTGVSNVSLYLNGSLNLTNTSGVNNVNYSFSLIGLALGPWEWFYRACDTGGYCGNSSTWYFTVTAAPGPPPPPIINITACWYNETSVLNGSMVMVSQNITNTSALSWAWFDVNGSLYDYSSNDSDTFYFLLDTSSMNGNYSLMCLANNSVNNVTNLSDGILEVTIPPSPPPPSAINITACWYNESSVLAGAIVSTSQNISNTSALSWAWFDVNGSLYDYSSNDSDTFIYSLDTSSMYGNYSLMCYANNTANNVTNLLDNILEVVTTTTTTTTTTTGPTTTTTMAELTQARRMVLPVWLSLIGVASAFSLCSFLVGNPRTLILYPIAALLWYILSLTSSSVNTIIVYGNSDNLNEYRFPVFIILFSLFALLYSILWVKTAFNFIQENGLNITKNNI